jgi:hypothetical protein
MFETIETWIVCVCVCVLFSGQEKILKYLWTGYGSRCTGVSVSITATLLGVSSSNVSRVYKEWSTTQRRSRRLDATVGSIGVNMGQHPCGTFSTPCRVHVPTN